MAQGSEEPRDDRLPLLRAIVAIARADGAIDEAERRHIGHLMDFLHVTSSVREQVEAALSLDAPAPALPAPDDLPDYPTRLYVFQQALAMTFADGVVDGRERELLDQLAVAMRLEADHVARAWERAEEMWGI